MPFASATSNQGKTNSAIDEVCRAVAESLDGVAPDLTFLFVSHHHASRFGELASQVNERLPSQILLGCTAETVIGGAREHEETPTITLWSAVLPGANLVPFELSFEETPDGLLCTGMPEDLGAHLSETRAVFVLGEPFSSAPTSLISLLGDELPGIPVMGGMASGGNPGENRLFLADREISSGAVGVIVRGGPRISSVVSQGCRPIGTPYIVTKAERNVIYEMGGVPPLGRLQMIYPTLSERDRKLVESGVHLGVVMNEYQETFQRGDFLIINVFGVDRNTGALATGSHMRVGQTVQFHIRDADTAEEDLAHMLDRFTSCPDPSGRAALLFSCNGRGTRMFPDPNHDAALIQQRLGPLPLAGFFAQGEFGPVGGKNYIHGFTASIALFEEG